MMNRIPKYRVWDIKRKIMMYVDGYNSLSIYEDGYCIYYGDKHALTEETSKLMQFTGRHDKNGKEIYEEDIIKFDIENYPVKYEKIGAVFYSTELLAFMIDSKVNNYYLNDINYSEIIGNIYENPELLK